MGHLSRRKANFVGTRSHNISRRSASIIPVAVTGLLTGGRWWGLLERLGGVAQSSSGSLPNSMDSAAAARAEYSAAKSVRLFTSIGSMLSRANRSACSALSRKYEASAIESHPGWSLFYRSFPVPDVQNRTLIQFSQRPYSFRLSQPARSQEKRKPAFQLRLPGF
jgi:hypothetical protein